MYLVACKLIDKEPKSCLVFEDSMSGIKAAVAAGIKNIVAVKGDNPELDTDKIEEVRVTIDDYTQLNETITVENFSDRYDNKNFNKTK